MKLIGKLLCLIGRHDWHYIKFGNLSRDSFILSQQCTRCKKYILSRIKED